MTPSDVHAYYKSGYRFSVETGMSTTSYFNWSRNGFVPIKSQIKLQELTKGALKYDGGVVNEGSLLFRFHRGTLKDSMRTLTHVFSRQHLLDHINEKFSLPIEAIVINHYGRDDRIDWDTYIVLAMPSWIENKFPVGFLSGSPNIWSKDNV